MKIAITADPELPAPPRHYGGIERIVDMLARGLVARGHDVTLFAHPKSQSAGRLVAWPGRSSRSVRDTIRNAALLTRAVASGRFDLVHSMCCSMANRSKRSGAKAARFLKNRRRRWLACSTVARACC